MIICLKVLQICRRFFSLKRIKLVLVGAGKIAHIHTTVYKKISDELFIEVSYVLEPDIKKFEKWEKNYKKTFKGSTSPTRINSLEERKDIQEYVVMICSPNETHSYYITKALSLNAKAVITEKPAFLKEKDLINFRRFDDKKLYLQENYFHSTLLMNVKDFIKKEDLEIEEIYLEFSKGRRKDSINN